MELDERAEKAIAKTAWNILQRCSLNEGLLGWPPETNKDIKKLLDTVHKRTSKWLRRNDVIYIFFDEIYDRLRQEGWSSLDTELTGDLRRQIGDGGIRSVCQSFTDKIQSLPQRYRVYFELPRFTDLPSCYCEIADDVHIVLNHRASSKNALSASTRNAPGEPGELRLMDGRVYIALSGAGYIRGRTGGLLFPSLYGQFKHIVMLGLADGIFKKTQRSVDSLLFNNAKPLAKVAIEDKVKGEQITFTIDFPLTAGEFLWGLELNGPFFEDQINKWHAPKPSGLLTSLVDNGSRRPRTDESVGTAFCEALKRAFARHSRLARQPGESPDGSPIRTALDWAFESEINDNETFALIQACIGLEALLGDSTSGKSREKRSSLTELLANRFAYLLGGARSERERAKELFMRIYDVRSDLVHGSVAVLNEQQGELLSDAQRLLMLAILKELDAIQG